MGHEKWRLVKGQVPEPLGNWDSHHISSTGKLAPVSVRFKDESCAPAVNACFRRSRESCSKFAPAHSAYQREQKEDLLTQGTQE